MAGIDQRVISFTDEALRTGMSREDIRSNLKAAGWSEEQIRDVFATFAETDCAIPVPKPKPYLSAVEAFNYLLMFTALYMSAFYLGDLLFNAIDLWLPDYATSQTSYTTQNLTNGIRFGIAILVIFFPAYVLLSARINREVRRDPSNQSSRIRKWLGYLTLFVAAVFILGDLVGLVYRFLMGDLTVTVFLKILVIGVIAGAVFAYYLWDLRQDGTEAESRS